MTRCSTSAARSRRSAWEWPCPSGPSWFALPHARIMIHQPLISGGGISGQATEIEIEAKEIVDTKRRLNEIIAKHTGQTVDKVARDSERNYYLSAEEGKA